MDDQAEQLPCGIAQQATAPIEPKAVQGKPNADRFIGLVSILVGILLYLLQTNGVEMNWKASLAAYLIVALGCAWAILRHAIPHLRMIAKILVTAIFLCAVGICGYVGTVKQYRRDHKSNSVITPPQAPLSALVETSPTPTLPETQTPVKVRDTPKQEKTGVASDERQPQPVIIQTSPLVGNLSDRAIALSNEILEDLLRHGWRNWGDNSKQQASAFQRMPRKPEEMQQWIRSRSSYFRFRFLERVVDIRNEFAQLHLRDERIDEFLKYEGIEAEANRQMAAFNPAQRMDTSIHPQQIEELAERLRVLANQVRDAPRAEPKLLKFSATREQSENKSVPDHSFNNIIRLYSPSIVLRGYIVVEYEGIWGRMGSDLADSKVVFNANDDEVSNNAPLKAYLSSHLGKSCVFAIGNTPLMPDKPVHLVFADSNAAFRVLRVILFDR